MTNTTLSYKNTTSTSIDITVKFNAKYAVYIKIQLNGTHTSERQFGGDIVTSPGGKFISLLQCNLYFSNYGIYFVILGIL